MANASSGAGCVQGWGGPLLGSEPTPAPRCNGSVQHLPLQMVTLEGSYAAHLQPAGLHQAASGGAGKATRLGAGWTAQKTKSPGASTGKLAQGEQPKQLEAQQWQHPHRKPPGHMVWPTRPKLRNQRRQLPKSWKHSSGSMPTRGPLGHVKQPGSMLKSMKKTHENARQYAYEFEGGAAGVAGAAGMAEA